MAPISHRLVLKWPVTPKQISGWIFLGFLPTISVLLYSDISYFFTPFSPQFRGIQLFLVATILSHRYNSRTGLGETKVESHASSDTRPNQAALLLNTARFQPGSQPSEETPCTWQPWLARTAPGMPQESLVRDETRISLPANPSLTRTTLGQLCVTSRTSRPGTTEPGREPRGSGGTASVAMQGR